MKFLKENITTILLIVIAVFVVLQLKSCFDKVNKPEQMIRNEEQLKFKEEKRISDSLYYAGELQKKSDSISVFKQNDNTIVNKLSSNDKKIKASNSRVDALTDAELERAINEHYSQ